MQAGKLRHRIQLQSMTTVDDTVGYPVETWGTYATIWAEVRMVTAGAGETFSSGAAQRQAISSYNVRIRHRDGMSPLHRVIYDSETLRILDIQDRSGRTRELMLICEAVTDDA